MDKMKKIAGNLDICVKTVEKVCTVCVCVVAVCAVLVLLLGDRMLSGGTSTVTLGAVEFEFAESYMPFVAMKLRIVFGLLFVALLLVFVCWVARILRSIMQPMVSGEPFGAAVSAQLDKLSRIALIGGGVLSLVRTAGEMALYYLYDLETVFLNEHILSCSAVFELDLTFLILFAVLKLLSYVFRYGEELQQQSDETL